MKKFILAAIVAILGVISISAQSGVFVVRQISGVEKSDGRTFMIVDNRRYSCEVADYLVIKNDTASAYYRVSWTGEKPFTAVAKAGEAKIDTLIVDDVRLDSLDNVILSFTNDTLATPKFSNPEWGKVRKGDTVIRFSLNCATMRFTRFETLKANAEAKRKHDELVAANRAAREENATEE